MSSPLVLQALEPKQSLLRHTLLEGYLIVARKMDKFGRRTIQVLGFAVMAATSIRQRSSRWSIEPRGTG